MVQDGVEGSRAVRSSGELDVQGGSSRLDELEQSIVLLDRFVRATWDVLVIPQRDADRSRAVRIDPQSKSAFLIVEAKYWTKPVGLGTGREFLGLRRDSSAKAQAFVCTIAESSAIALLAGSPGVEYDDGVLPALAGEQSLRSYFHRLLRDYRDRQ